MRGEYFRERKALNREIYRLMSKIQYSRKRPGCWLWKGNTVVDKYGFYPYGKVWRTGSDGKRIVSQAHRAVWQLIIGPIPTGKKLVNQCGETRCVNPEHWKLADHWRDA